MNDMELAEEIERKVNDWKNFHDPDVSLSKDQCRQIITALRREHERPPSGEMVMVPRAAPKPLLAELAKCHHTRLDQRRISAAQTVWARLLGLALSAVEAEGRKS